MYTGFAIILAYAAEGWYRMHVGQPRQLQTYDGKQKLEKPSTYAERPAPTAAAVRTVAALLTSIVYAFVPFAPVSSSWPVFAAWVFGFAVYWDIHFFIVHKAVHENRWLYKNIHKLHHTHKQPGVFTAYFVTYQSHVLTEQSVVFLAAACGLPRDVFTWVMWWGTLMTYVEHGGHDVESIRLSPLPITFGQLGTLLSPWSLVLGGATPAEHDWHHEKFTTNYALNFKILDQLFGSYHPGREPGEAVREASAAAHALSQAPAEAPRAEAEAEAEAGKEDEGAKVPTAQYTELRKSTPQDWVVQGAAFDKYAADGNIVRNILELVQNMKVRRLPRSAALRCAALRCAAPSTPPRPPPPASALPRARPPTQTPATPPHSRSVVALTVPPLSPLCLPPPLCLLPPVVLAPSRPDCLSSRRASAARLARWWTCTSTRCRRRRARGVAAPTRRPSCARCCTTSVRCCLRPTMARSLRPSSART